MAVQFTLAYTQEMHKPAKLRQCGHLVYSGDNASTVVSVVLTVDGEPYIVTGTVRANAVLSNGTTVQLEGTLTDNVASVELLESCFVAPGPMQLYIRVISGGTVTTVFSGMYTVIKSASGTPIDPGGVVPDLEDLLDKFDQMTEAIGDCEEATEAAEEAAEAAQAAALNVGNSYYEEVLRIDGFNVSGQTELFDVDWKAGDIIKLDYATDDPGRYLTVVTYNGSNLDYFIQTSDTSASGSSEITLTADATQVKVYASLISQYKFVDLLFSRKHPTTDLGMTLTQNAAEAQKTAAAVGDEYAALWSSHYSQTGVKLYDVDFKAGDVIRVEYATNDEGGNLTVVTADGEGTTKDILINTNARIASGQKTVTLTQDAPKLKLYCTYGETESPYVDIKVSKYIGTGKTLFERVYDSETDIAALEDRMDDVETVAAGAAADVSDLADQVGDEYWEVAKRIDGFAVRATTEIFDVDFKAGDVIRFSYASNDPGKMLTVVTYVNGSNTDYFIQTSSTESSGTVETTITADATKLKVYAMFTNSKADAHVDLLFLRHHDADDLGKTILEQVAETKALSEETATSAEYVESEIDYCALGETILTRNDAYNGDAFMGIVMLDNNYKYFSVAQIKRIIDKMASVGLNYLELGFGGSGRGLSFALDNMTFTVRGRTYDMTGCLSTSSGKYLSESDMEEIISYAVSNGIQIIPSFNTISHASAVLVEHPEFWYRGAYDYSVNVDSKLAMDFAVGLAEMYGKWFAERGCSQWNLCADEFSVDYATMQQNGEYSYADAINRVAYALSKYRYTIHVWNDPICANESIYPHINRRLIVDYWAKKKSGYASLPRIINSGYRVVNANRSIYWVANSEAQVTVEQMRAFDITKFDNGYTYYNPVGVMFCVWIGNLEDPALDDDGEGITDDVLPLIEAFGQTIAGQHHAVDKAKAPAIIDTASGAVAHIVDGADGEPARSVVAQIVPVQDLHGYDAPWPAGGGKNILSTSGLTLGAPSDTAYSNATKRTFTTGTYISGLTHNNYYTPKATGVEVSDNLIKFTTNASAYGISIPLVGLEIGQKYTISATTTTGRVKLSFYAQDGTFISFVDSATGTVPENTYYTLANFQALENDVEATFRNIMLEKGETATSFAPYSNVCPITGRTGVNVKRTGKNMFDQDDSDYLNSEVAVYGTIDTKGLAQINKLNAGTYTLSFKVVTTSLNGAQSESTRVGLFFQAVNDNVNLYVNGQIDVTPTVGGVYEKRVTFSLPQEYVGKFTSFWVYTGKSVSQQINFYGVVYDVQIEPGSTATSYEPYSGTTYPVSWQTEAGTVYGGYIDIVSGLLTVTDGHIASYAGETLPGAWISDRDVYAAGETPTTGAEVVYKLATPQTYQLTPTEVKTLLGVNNVWADTGDTSIVYPADTKLYIDGKIASLQALILENG